MAEPHTLKAFHERIQCSADEREDIQKKTFTKWINSQLAKHGKLEVGGLFEDFCDGKSLLALLEALSGVPLPPEKGRMRVHHLNNVNRALCYLTDRCKIKLVNISSDDVVNGNPKLILGLVWTIILHWQVKRAMAAVNPDQSSNSGASQEGFEKTLLVWCQSATKGYRNVNVQNFTSSWSDGFAFNALIHSHRPDLFDYDELVAVNDTEYTLLHAFQVANSSLNIAKLLDPEDMVRPDKKSVLVYLTCLYEVLHSSHNSLVREPGPSPHSLVGEPGPSPHSLVGEPRPSPYSLVGERGPSPHSLVGEPRHSPQPLTPVSSVNEANDDAGQHSDNQVFSVQPLDNQNPHPSISDNQNATQSASLTTSLPPAEVLLPAQDLPQQKTRLHAATGSPQVPSKVARFENVATSNQSISPADIASGPPDTQSDVTTASGISSLTDLTTFNSLLEITLTWLQDAKEKFNKMQPVSDDVEIVKTQFHEHEKYMMELTKSQSNIGGLLMKGNTLLLADDLTLLQEQEVRNQVELLNEEWEELRVGAMERQTSLQQSLMDLQLDQLNELSSWLTDMETKMESFDKKVENIETLENVGRCVEEHQQLQESLERQQDRVSSLQNMVVIVEDGVNDPAYQSMERMLEELGTRWASVCQWIDEKWMHLQDVDIKWKSYHSNADEFNRWLDEQEVILGRMQLSNIQDPQIVLNQVQQLKAIEGDMEDQMSRYEELNMVGQALISYLPSFPQTTEKIQLRLEEYNLRWDKLVQRMEQQSKLIAESGIDPEAIIAAAAERREALAEEFDGLSSKITRGMSEMDSTLQLLESNDSELSLEERSGMADDMDEGSVAIAKDFQELQTFVKQNAKSLGEQKVAELSFLWNKWKTCNSRSTAFQEQIKVGLLQEQAHKEVKALQDLLHSYKVWAESAHSTAADADSVDFTDHCEQCRMKMKAMRDEQDRVDELFAARHSKHVVSDAGLAADITQLHTKWAAILKALDDRLNSLSERCSKNVASFSTDSPLNEVVHSSSPRIHVNKEELQNVGSTDSSDIRPRKYLDAADALITWLCEVEEVLAERTYITDLSTMDKNLLLYQDLQKAVAEHGSDVEYVNKTGEDLVKRSSLSSAETSDSLQLQLSSLNSRWQAVSENIQDKLDQLAQGIDKLKHFENQVNGLTRWMSDMEHFLRVEQPVVGDTETLQTQISQSDGALADIVTLKAVVVEINAAGTGLVSGSEKEFGVELLRELEKMNDRWMEINQLAQTQNKILKDSLCKSASLVENITALNSFLTNFDSQVSEKLVFTTKTDLDASCEKIKKLEASLEDNRPQLELVQTISSELMERSRQDSLPRLLNRLRHIDNKWKLMTDRLSAKQEECSDICTRYSDFLSLVQSDEAYITQLENKLVSEGNQAVDAEDMAAEMDELESVLEERDKLSSATLHELAAWFKQNNTLVGETQNVQLVLDQRIESIIDKARQRVAILDRASQKSQDTQLKLSEMETWMNEVNSLFREWNDQDLLAGDLLEDHKTLQGEFEEKDSFLRSIETQIKDFRALSKTQAADRLEKKLNMIKDDYAIAQQNFLKWQRPVDFDPKLRRTQQQLHEIDDKIYLIEIFSEDPEHVAIRLEQCTKFYTIMSEIKTEVEYVIKTGRQLVEKKQVDFPRRVNQTLDALKSLYNRLGGQVSQARKDLDKALKISKVIAKHIMKVSDLVEVTEARLGHDIVTLDEESVWVQETEQNFEKVHPTFSAITTLFDQFQLFAEETALDEAKENMESLKERWQSAIQSLAARQRSILAQRSNIDADFEMFKVKCNKLLSHLKSLNEMLNSGENVQKLQAELINLREDVTTLRDEAGDISSKGDDYKGQITPIIGNVNISYQHLCSNAQLGEEVSVAVQSTAVRMEVDNADLSNRGSLAELKSAMACGDADKYEVASLFARCEAAQSELAEADRESFQTLLIEWNSRRNSTIERWQNYQLHSTLMSLALTELEEKLDMAHAQSDLLSEIEAEIARRQVEINAINEQAEDLTEHDTPPIDQQLLQLNQRWVGIRSRVANFKPATTPQINGTTSLHQSNGTTSLELSPPTNRQKYEYAVINKARKNPTPAAITPEINIESEPIVTSSAKRDMTLNLQSPGSPTLNNNVLFVTSPASKTSTPLSGADVDDESISLEEMTVSTSSKRSIVVTDLDEAAKSASTDNLEQTPTFSKRLSAEVEESLGDVRRLQSRIGILQQQLKTSGVEMDQYTHENFNSSQDLLTSVHVSMEVLEEDINRTESFLRSRLSTTSASSTSQLQDSLSRLQEAWNQLNSSYRNLRGNFDEALTLWTQFHTILRVITAWLEATEKQLKRSRDKSGELIIEQAKDIQKELEDGMSHHQAIIHSLARTAVPLAGKLRPADAERITEKVSKVTGRWKEITVEIRGRKPRLESLTDSGKCLDVLDDLSFWLDETEIIITSTPNYMEEISLREALEKVKDRRQEIPHKKEALEFVSRSARDLWSLPELKADDKEKIGRDIHRVARKWSLITAGIEDRQRHLEASIENLVDLLFGIGKVNAELWRAIEDLQPKIGSDEFANIEEVYPRNQSVTIESLSIWYREVLLLYKRYSAILPNGLDANFRRLNIRWSAVREKTLLHRADSDSSIEETLATGGDPTRQAVSADDIYEEPRQSVFMEDHIPHTSLPEVSISVVDEDEACPSPPLRKESLQQVTDSQKYSSSSSAPLNRELTLTLLRDRLAVLNRTVSNKRVDVTDETQISDSEIRVKKLTVAVQEILRQLSMFPEADNQVSGLRTECAECQVKSLARGRQLQQLLIDSHKYTDQMAMVDSGLSELEAKVEARRCEAIGDAVDVVNKQIQQHMMLEMEIQSWKDNYSILSHMTTDLLATYPNEDTTNLKLSSESMANRWSSVQQFAAEQSQTLISQKNLLEDYDKALEEFLVWLTEEEAVADILLEEVKVNDPMRSSTWALRSKDLQTQIESHQTQNELLSITGKKMAAAAGPGDAGDIHAMKRRLDEMNERWTQLRAKTVQIRCRLESSMDQWAELISRCRLLIDYLITRENELIAARPVSGSLEGVKQQQLAHEDWKMRLESKTSDFEHAISTGRFYLERERADRRLSSASCDSRIMDELDVESSDAKTVIKNIRRHVRLLNQRWLDLHSKSDRWCNQLASSRGNMEAIENLVSLASRHLNEIDISMQAWKNVHDYPVSDLPRQLTSARALRRRNEQLSEVVLKSKAIIRTHEQAEGPIDGRTKQTIGQLSDRQQEVDKEIGDRVSQLVGLNRTLVPEVSDLLKDSTNRPYERATTPTGVPYYINHEKKTTQWDHPRMVNLLSQLPKFNTTKFSAYRTAQKLRKMQKALGLHSIRLKDVIKSCQEHKMSTPTGEEVIDINLIISCLRDLFEHLADDRHAAGVNIPLSIDLSLNWLLNVYDLGRQGQLRTLSFQVGLVIMCRGAVEDKFNYLLSCLADKSGSIDERKLSLLISDCVQIPRQLGELSSFGGANIDPSVQSCLDQAKGATFVNSAEFMKWLALEPQSMVWLPVYHRLATSESCRHQAKCSLCKNSPIIGLRYRCLRCFNFNLCQTCFFAGKKGKNHKLSHPMKEYYCASTSNDEMKDLSSPMRKKYSSGRYIKKHQPKGYLPLNKLADGDSTFSRESLSLMSGTGTPVSSPSSLHINYEIGGGGVSLNSNDGLPSRDLDSPRADDPEIHKEIEKYADTLDRLERQNTNNGNSNTVTASDLLSSSTVPSATPEPTKTAESSSKTTSNSDITTVSAGDNDEHKFIERYCSSLTASPAHNTNGLSATSEPHLGLSCESPLKSPMQIVMSLEDNQKTELEAMIRDLEDENRNLQTEYQKLQAERDQQPVPQVTESTDERQAEMLAEAKLLRQHKGRLESRMKILEDHNKQLEAQLRRLRHLLDQPAEPSSCSELSGHSLSAKTNASNSPLRVKRLPPTYEKQYSTEPNDANTGNLTGSQRMPKLSGSIGELFQMAGQVGKAVGQLVSVVSDQPSTS